MALVLTQSGSKRNLSDFPALEMEVFDKRVWKRADFSSDKYQVFYDLTDAALLEIAAAIEAVRRKNIHLGIIEPEDFRVPSFARDVQQIRRRLDDSPGFVVIRGVEVSNYSRNENEIIYWGLSNYIGRVMRQNLRGERLDSVQNRGDKITDPYRIIETPRYFLPHTDNGMLEPRWPDYLGLMCLSNAKQGGENQIISAYALLDEIAMMHPDYLSRLSKHWHIDPPTEQRIPGGAPTWSKPILEEIGGELKIHYLRYYIDPGMAKAGCPMTVFETEILDYFDSLLQQDDFSYEYKLQPGEILFNNNNWTLHGRKAFEDHKDPARSRLLLRIWLWRRHLWPGTDPVDLDAAEYDGARTAKEGAMAS